MLQGVQDIASALVDASADLIEALTGAESPLNAVSASLAGLATALGVEQAIVAIDDVLYGRQVFCSGRTPLVDAASSALWEPPGVRTEPPRELDAGASRLIVSTVAAAFERARVSHAPATLPDDLIARLGAATERSARYGWGFTLVLVRFDHAGERAAQRVQAQLRASDTMVETGPCDLGILLPAAAGDDVPRILARVALGGVVPPFCYGLAACPGDANEPGALLALASQRRRDADRSRLQPEIHVLEPPRV